MNKIFQFTSLLTIEWGVQSISSYGSFVETITSLNPSNRDSDNESGQM